MGGFFDACFPKNIHKTQKSTKKVMVAKNALKVSFLAIISSLLLLQLTTYVKMNLVKEKALMNRPIGFKHGYLVAVIAPVSPVEKYLDGTIK